MPDHHPSWEHRERRFSSLYREHYRSIWAYAVRRVESQADVADVVADVFATAWRRFPELPDPPADLLWLYGVARRVVAGKRRSALRMRNLIARLQATAVPASTVTGDQVTDRVLAAVARLRPMEREAIALVHWEQLSHAEAAQVLGCSVNAVAIRVHRARARLRQELARPEPAPPNARSECGALVSDSSQASEG
ncbi:MAG TPA: RNA polymerase sigma factor [Streptosporangiaceae bacterium]|nr:RNA polymerase sigma factor [Streptosporangiaceae bacterium]